ncbi:hypothetical protein [Chryseobacterium sp. JK1]|uniref:hypothetical protein n=1 Tax=Chryseobacterium sp. JK1 TaxID=874294 RepID=UPI003D68ECF3
MANTQSYKKIQFYLHTFFRYFIATMMLSYAFSKLLGTQFVTQPSAYDKPVNLLSGFELTWYYYSYSLWYGSTIAIAQIISSVLLFFRRTTRLGIVLFLGIMVNIVMMDFAYDIEGAKGMACALLAMGLFIFFSEYPVFYKYFIEYPPLFSNEDRPQWINKISKIKWVYIPVVFIGFIVLISSLKNKYMGINQFYGTWKNIDKTSPIERISFQAANTFVVNKECNNVKINEGEYTFTKDSLVLKSTMEDHKEVSQNDTPNSDDKKTHPFLKGKYTVDHNSLTIQAEGNKKVVFKRVR